MSNLLLITEHQYKIQTVGIALVAILVILILLHLITNAGKIRKQEKKNKRRIELEFNINSKETQRISSIVNGSKKYKGSFKSYKGKEKKEISNFLKRWLKKVPYYSRLNHKKADKKYKNIYIVVSKDPAFKKKKKQWEYVFKKEDRKKNAKFNYKKLVKFMNKTKCSKGILNVILNVYTEDSNFKQIENNYSYKEEHNYITYYVAKRKR